jgi:predicted nuclease of predicted toxin-antitoxin system
VWCKLDENIGASAAEFLRGEGHDVSTVLAQGLSGASDAALFEVCCAERRVLITLDHDFGQTLRFDPRRSAGIVVLELGARPGRTALANRLRELCATLKTETLANELWIVEPGRVRMHTPDD